MEDRYQQPYRNPDLEHHHNGVTYRGNFFAFDDGQSVISNDTWSCVIVVLTFWFFGQYLSLPFFWFLSIDCNACRLVDFLAIFRIGIGQDFKFFIFTGWYGGVVNILVNF